MIKPMPLGRAVPDGFTVEDFTIDDAANTVTCPAKITRPVSAKGRASFGSACGGCPLMGRCTTAKNGRKMLIHPHDRLRPA
ncbi:hypothetical protein [Arthrobacter sp. UYEF21]|uniref:hypothetical protein n=1 Tax=Arthrobacter sp. UYEF21 TaxID=1756364 RepID=UPI003397F103